jgi:CheY-like chemotaxis protein
VDDNTDGRESLCLLLDALGHRAEGAADGPAGVRQALATAPDVAIVEVGLSRPGRL